MSRLLIWCVDSLIPLNEQIYMLRVDQIDFLEVLFAVWHRSAISTLPLDAFHLYSANISPFTDPELTRLTESRRIESMLHSEREISCFIYIGPVSIDTLV